MKNSKNKTSKILILALMTSSIFAACKKEKNEPAEVKAKMEVVKTREDSLMAKWMLTGYEIESAGMTKTDGFDDLDLCDKDDIMEFAAINIVRWDYGQVTCDPSDLNGGQGIWKLTNNK